MNPLFHGLQIHYRAQELPEISTSGGMSEAQTDATIRDLEGRIDKLSMVCCAMWTILQAHTEVTDADLVRLVQELDLSDGELDGKARVEQVAPCVTCKRPVSLRHLRCIYCGTERRPGNAFEEVL